MAVNAICFGQSCKPLVVTYVLPSGANPARVPEFDFEPVMMCEPAPSTVKVTVLRRWDESAAPGTPPLVEAYVFPTNAPYGGSLAALVDCAGAPDIEVVPACYQDAATGLIKYTRIEMINTSAVPPSSVGVLWRDALGAATAAPAGVVPCEALESDAVPGCAAGVVVTQWVQKNGRGMPTGVVSYTNALGAVIAAPAGWAPGPCAVACPPLVVGLKGYPAGGAHTFVANLKQYCITITKATVTDPVTITWPGGSEIVTACFNWCQSVDNTCEFITGPISVSGNANTTFNVDWRAV